MQTKKLSQLQMDDFQDEDTISFDNRMAKKKEAKGDDQKKVASDHKLFVSISSILRYVYIYYIFIPWLYFIEENFCKE